MDFLNNIDNDTIIITSPGIKKEILKTNKLMKLKVYTLDNFLHEYFFDYDEDAILYLMNKYLYKYEVSKKYIDNLYYIEDKTYNNSKLDFLVNIYHELKENNLLIFNEYFHDYLKRVKVIFYGIKVSNNILNRLSIPYEIVERAFNNYHHEVYEFNNIEDEVYYVCQEIAKLIDTGIDPTNIKLTNVDEDYYDVITRIFLLHNLKVNINYKTRLSSYEIVKKFTNLYDGNNLERAIEELDHNDPIYSELIKVLNNYLKYNNINLIRYKLDNTYITSKKYDKAIDIVSYQDYPFSDNEYIFMLNFNEESIPTKKNDTDYITDDIAPILNMDTSNKINEYNKDLTLNIIKSIKNLIITYKNTDYKNSYYPSSLCENMETIKKENDYHTCYSEIYFKNLLVKMYDEYFKYGYKNNRFDLVNNNFKIKYNSYSHKYQVIDRNLDKLYLSYTKLNLYNKCAFSYYLTDILKLSIYETNFSAIIGSMVHYVLFKCLSNDDINPEKYILEYIKPYDFNKKELFFLNKYTTGIKGLLDEIILEREYMLFNEALYEKKIDIDIAPGITFTGIIDKVLYYQDKDTTYVALIDYKTGNDDINLKYLKYGIDIQLPIYLYLSTKLDFTNMKYVGFYLQKMNMKDNDYRLLGYSNSNPDTISIIDKDYDKSAIIKGLKTNKDGSFAKSSNVLSDNEINDVLDEAKNQINKVIDKIKENDFTINPKNVLNKNISCKYCRFKDICFMDKDDEVTLSMEVCDGVDE